MKRLLPHYSLLSIVFFIGCIQAIIIGIPKELKIDPITHYLRSNPTQSALIVLKNGALAIERNAMQPLPLASLSKIVIAMAYIDEVEAGRLEPDQQVPIASLERFNIEDENYENWLLLGQKEGWINNGVVALRYVAQGVIRLSSSANADFLMDIVGIKKINALLKRYKLPNHQPIFPFNASAILSHNEQNLQKKVFLSAMDELSDQEYMQQVLQVQAKLAADTNGFYKLSLPKHNAKNQAYRKLWSDRFSKAPAQSYAKLLGLLAERSNFSTTTLDEIDFVFENWTFQENPGIDQQLDHLTYKAGSTGFLLNTVLSTTDKEGNQATVVLFMNELNPKFHRLIGKTIGDYVFKLAMEEAFVQEVQEALLSPSPQGNN